MLCKYLQKNETVTIVDVMGNGITSLGCEFFGKMLQPSLNEAITILKLDHNPIGSDGLGELARGLATNNTMTVIIFHLYKHLKALSLDYCNIDFRGGKYLQQILAYIDSKIGTLSLQGNILQEKGIFEIFRVLNVNTNLKVINLADNQFGESDPDLIKEMCKVFENPDACGYFDLQYNGIYDEGM